MNRRGGRSLADTLIVGASKRKFWIRISGVGGLLAVAALDAQGDARQDATGQTQLAPVAPVSLISISSHVTSFTAQFPGERTYEAAAQGCPAPAGVRVVSASVPESGQSVALGTLVNGAPWAIAIYLNQDPDVPGAAPFTILFPGAIGP